MSRFLERAQDDLGALVATTAVVLRRGIVAAVLWLAGVAVALTLVGVTIGAFGNGNGWATLLGIFGFFTLPVIYGGLLAAFTLALDDRPTGAALLDLVASRYLQLVGLTFIGAFLALLGAGTTGLTAGAFGDWSRSATAKDAVRTCIFGSLTVAPLGAWCRYFVLPAAAVFGRGPRSWESPIPAQVAAKRPVSFLVVMLLPPALLIAAIPDPASESAAHGLLDPTTLTSLRIATSLAALLAALLLTAALSVAACRTSGANLGEAP